MKPAFFSWNSPKPSVAQSLRIRKRLWAFLRGSLAVPTEDGRPALPLRTNHPSFSRILRDSRRQVWENSRQNPSAGRGIRAGGPHERGGLLNFSFKYRSQSPRHFLFSHPSVTVVEALPCFLTLGICPPSVPGRRGILPLKGISA